MVQSWETACCHGFFEQDAISFSDITVLCCPLGVCILFLSKFSQCISFPKELPPVSLGDCFTWNGHSWEFIVEASTHHELGWGQSINCVRCGSILEEAVLQCRFPVTGAATVLCLVADFVTIPTSFLGISLGKYRFLSMLHPVDLLFGLDKNQDILTIGLPDVRRQHGC